jgi:hypothetical protein
VVLCWSEKAQLSGDRRKALKDSTVMNEASLTFVEYFVKRTKRSLEPKEDLHSAEGQA